MNKRMTKTEYLYGVTASELTDIRPALNERIEKAEILLKELVYDGCMTDTTRIYDVQKAIHWNKNMLKEYENE